MQKMGNLDYYVLAKELAALEGGRINKIYSNGVFRLKLNRNGEVNFIAEAGVRAHLTKYVEEAPERPSDFVMLIRKRLDNAKIKSVKQTNFDRLLSFVFDAKDGLFVLVFELFQNGNVVFCGSDDRIIDALKRETYAARALRPKQPYSPPPSNKKHPLELTEADIPEGKAVAALAKAVNLPPFYLEEACSRAGQEYGAEINDKKAVVKALHSLFDEAKPCVYYENGKPIAFSPFPLKKLGETEVRFFPSLSEAVDAYYSSVERETKKVNPEHKKLLHLIETQKTALAEFGVREKEARASAEYIGAHLGEAEAALEKARRERKRELEF
ncbi:Uncharacterised protein [Candidatus Norongarragalina meridionalis]|nr:Uncharacterised protein [Candidatus Norongarragalina meridionalis]